MPPTSIHTFQGRARSRFLENVRQAGRNATTGQDKILDSIVEQVANERLSFAEGNDLVLAIRRQQHAAQTRAA